MFKTSALGEVLGAERSTLSGPDPESSEIFPGRITEFLTMNHSTYTTTVVTPIPSHGRYAFVGGHTVRPILVTRVQGVLKWLKLVNVYGSTDCHFVW